MMSPSLPPLLRRFRTWVAAGLFAGAVVLLILSRDETRRPPVGGPAHRIAHEDSALYAQAAKDGKQPSADPTDLCRRHGWKPFRPTTSTDSLGGTATQPRARKIYDLFMVNTELDWLEVRLNTSYEEVDHFIVVEAPRTFTGLEKPLAIKQNWDRFAAYHDKMIYAELKYPPDFHPGRAWDREDLQRDAMFTQVFPNLKGAAAPQLGDVLIVADVDEVLRPETLRVLRACTFPRRLTLLSRFHYYGFEFIHRFTDWPHPQATFFEGMDRTVKPVNLRNGDGGLQPLIYWDKDDLWNAGWHCSYCYDSVEHMLRKMASTSHLSQNKPKYHDRARMVEYVRSGKDLWDRKGQFYDRIANNTDMPPFLRQHPDRFGYLLDRSGESAGFKDYKP